METIADGNTNLKGSVKNRSMVDHFKRLFIEMAARKLSNESVVAKDDRKEELVNKQISRPQIQSRETIPESNVPDRRISEMLEYVLEINHKNAVLERDNEHLRRSYDTIFGKAVRCEKELSESHSTVRQLEAKINILGTKLATAENDKLLLQNQLLGLEKKYYETYYEEQAKKLDRSESDALKLKKIVEDNSDVDRQSSELLKLKIRPTPKEYENAIKYYKSWEKLQLQGKSNVQESKKDLACREISILIEKARIKNKQQERNNDS